MFDLTLIIRPTSIHCRHSWFLQRIKETDLHYCTWLPSLIGCRAILKAKHNATALGAPRSPSRALGSSLNPMLKAITNLIISTTNVNPSVLFS